MIYLVTLAHLGKIIKAGGKVYAYKPGFNHAKTVISDDKYAFIGTVNVDYRSMFLHFECGNFLYNNDCIKDMKEDFLKAVNESEIISYERWEKRAISTKVLDFILTVLAPLM
jgi:cardiolipin synthase